ncbi:MAG TPA: hypothetical protein VNK48_14300 [Xanthobacteraceae bacterium]|nr:hypothetical protein [Xanthobacteraceae bacterium]
MPIRVEAPGGISIEFPDNTDAAVVQNVMRQATGGAAPKTDQSYWAGLGRQALQGATLGFGDEILAGVKSHLRPFGNFGSYEHELARERAHNESFAREYPWRSTIAQIGGGLALAAVPGVNVATGAQRLLAGASTVGQAATRAGAVGAGYAAVGGFGAGEGGVENRLVNATAAAPLGFAAGAALGAAGRKVGQMYGAYRAAKAEAGDPGRGAMMALERSFSRDRIDPAQVRSEMLATGARAITPDQLADALQSIERGETVQAIASRLGLNARTLGEHLRRFEERTVNPLNLVDRARLTRPGGGENTGWLLRAAAATPGEARTIAAQQLTERQVGAGARLLDAVRKTLGDGDVDGRIAQAMQALRQAESKAYRAAYANEKPFNIGPILRAWDKARGGRNTDLDRTIKNVVGAFYRPSQVITPDGRMGPVALHPVNTLAEFQRIRATDLRSAMERAQAAGDKTLLRELTRFKRHLDNVVRHTNPEWARANDMFRDGQAGQRALQLGEQTALRLNARARDTLRQFDRMSEPERELFRQGLSRAIQDRILNRQQTHDIAAELRLPGARKILQRVLGADRAAQLTRAVDEETAMLATYRSLGGSQTTPLREAIDENNAAALMTEALNVLQPKQFALELMRRGAARINAARNRELMRMLTDESPANQIAMLGRMARVRGARATGGSRGLLALGRGLPALGVIGTLPHYGRP